MNKEISERLNSLSDEKREFLIEKLISAFPTKQRSKLVGYFVTSEKVELDQLKSYLKEAIPDYMVPSELIEVKEIPRLPNGKVDRSSLEKQVFVRESVSDQDVILSDLELRLRQIWIEVLGKTEVGIDENFFEIGGDSISSIRVISKARNESIKIRPNQIFDHPTIRDLAKNVSWVNQVETNYNTNYTGTTQLSPIQKWFFKRENDQNHYWNQGYGISLKRPLEINRIKETFINIIKNHSGLRQTFIEKDSELLCQYKSFKDSDFIHYVQTPADDEFIRIQHEVNLEEGPLISLILGTEEETDSFIIIAHHLVIDMVSWSLLLAEFDSRLNNISNSANTPNQFNNWAAAINSEAAKQEFGKEIKYWLDHNPIPNDVLIKEKEIESVEFIISDTVTKLLREDSLSAYNSKFDELIFTAFLNAISKAEGEDRIQVWLESHGRKSTKFGEDLSDAIGWFTSFYPQVFNMRLELEKDIVNVKEQLRSIPNEGMGYGYLVYNSNQISVVNTADFIFNYGGQNITAEYQLFREVEFIKENVRHPDSPAVGKMEFNCILNDNRLEGNVRFNVNKFSRKKIDNFINEFNNELNNIIEHCRTAEQKLTPSDFPDSNISSEDLDNLFDQL